MNTGTTDALSADAPSTDALSAAVFFGEILGPFFSHDPSKDNIRPAYAALAELEVEAAAHDWPLVEDATARAALTLMQQGATIDDALIWEYRRLFVGPAAKAAPPWGSVYTDWEGVVFGESTLALRQWLRENGIRRLGEDGTPEDHIGTMLLLMAWIAEHSPEKLPDYLRLHLLTWAGHFLEQLEAAAKHDFFRGLAAITGASLEALRAALNIAVEYPRFYR